ncbi:MAG: HAMP domain-containing histidine kinase [Bacteroidales bacterium]|nr:HAMP domain-containing histidine kinase [Bacteroidales bacterium]
MKKKTEELNREELIERVKVLEEYIRREKEANKKIKRTFISRVNHEIRTPLNSIIGFANLLSNNHLDDVKRKLYVKYMTNSTSSLISSIENLLDYSLLTAEQLELVEEKDIQLDGLFDELYTVFSTEKHLQEKYSVVLLLKKKKENNKVLVTSDRKRLKQLVTLLMMNALRGTRSGSIVFGYEILNDAKIRIFVSDSAEQFRTEYVRKMLEGKGDPEVISRNPDINLTIVRLLVELMKGTVKVVEHPGGKGNTVYLDLPLEFRIGSVENPAGHEIISRQDKNK